MHRSYRSFSEYCISPRVSFFSKLDVARTKKTLLHYRKSHIYLMVHVRRRDIANDTTFRCHEHRSFGEIKFWKYFSSPGVIFNVMQPTVWSILVSLPTATPGKHSDIECGKRVREMTMVVMKRLGWACKTWCEMAIIAFSVLLLEYINTDDVQYIQYKKNFGPPKNLEVFKFLPLGGKS